MKFLKFFLVYGLALIFSLFRLPVYLNGNGIYWADALIAGLLGMIGTFIYNFIEEKKKTETE